MQQPPYSKFLDAVSVHGIAPVKAGMPKGWRAALSMAGAWAVWMARLPGRIAEIRRNMALLGGMSDRELADIGLARQDLRDASALPLGDSPDVLFQRRAAERRRSA